MWKISVLLLGVLGFPINGQLISNNQNQLVPTGNASEVLTAAASSYSGSMQPLQGSMRVPYSSQQNAGGQNSYQMLSGGNNYNGMNHESYDTKPQSYGFDCYGKPPALYGNSNYDCRIFHVCQADGRQDTLKCPPKTKFNNYLGVCDWEDKIDNYCMPLYREESYGAGNGQNYAQGNQQQYSGSQAMNYAPQQNMNYGQRPAQTNQQYNKRY